MVSNSDVFPYYFLLLAPLFLPFAFLGFLFDQGLSFIFAPFNQGRCGAALSRLMISSDSMVCEGFFNDLISTQCYCDNISEAFEVLPGAFYGGRHGFLLTVVAGGEFYFGYPTAEEFVQTTITLAQDAAAAAGNEERLLALSVDLLLESSTAIGSCSALLSYAPDLVCSCEVCDDRLTFKVDCSDQIFPDGVSGAGLPGPKFDSCINWAFRVP